MTPVRSDRHYYPVGKIFSSIIIFCYFLWLKIINFSSEIDLIIIFGSNSNLNSRELIYWISEWDQLWNFWFLCLRDVQGISIIHLDIRCDRCGNSWVDSSGSVSSLNDYSPRVLWVCTQFTNIWTTQKSDLIPGWSLSFWTFSERGRISTSCWWDFL